MVRITVTVTEELKAKLEQIAQEQDRSVSWLVRDILQQYLQK